MLIGHRHSPEVDYQFGEVDWRRTKPPEVGDNGKRGGCYPPLHHRLHIVYYC